MIGKERGNDPDDEVQLPLSSGRDLNTHFSLDVIHDVDSEPLLRDRPVFRNSLALDPHNKIWVITPRNRNAHCHGMNPHSYEPYGMSRRMQTQLRGATFALSLPQANWLHLEQPRRR